MLKRVVFILSATAVFACGELPESPIIHVDPDTDPQDSDTPQSLSTPQVDTLPASYAHRTLPVRGTSEPFVTVFITGGAGAVATESASDGRFCVDVALAPGAQNDLEIFAQNDKGTTSEGMYVSVVHDDSDKEDPIGKPAPRVELAGGLVAETNMQVREGTLENLTDNQADTSVFLTDGRLWLDLGDTYNIEILQLTFVDDAQSEHAEYDDMFASEYDIFLTADENPLTTGSNLITAGWTRMVQETEGDGGMDSHVLPAAFPARWVAIELIADNSWWTVFEEDIRMSEFQVLGRSFDLIAGESDAPSCENGKLP